MKRVMMMAGSIVALLAACQPERPEDAGLASCGADALQGLVGKPADVLLGMTFDADTRILRPGMPVTMDYRPDRLNIEIDADERIVRVHCT